MASNTDDHACADARIDRRPTSQLLHHGRVCTDSVLLASPHDHKCSHPGAKTNTNKRTHLLPNGHTQAIAASKERTTMATMIQAPSLLGEGVPPEAEIPRTSPEVTLYVAWQICALESITNGISISILLPEARAVTVILDPSVLATSFVIEVAVALTPENESQVHPLPEYAFMMFPVVPVAVTWYLVAHLYWHLSGLLH